MGRSKNRTNLRRHEFDFSEAEQIFAGEFFTLRDERFDYGEQRFLTLGMLDGRVVAIAHTPRGGATRIISLRKASKNEEEIYYEEVRD